MPLGEWCHAARPDKVIAINPGCENSSSTCKPPLFMVMGVSSCPDHVGFVEESIEFAMFKIHEVIGH